MLTPGIASSRDSQEKMLPTLVNSMAYDLEKYRDKREKVLGVKKRGLSFGVLATLVSTAIVLGIGLLVIPKSIAYFQARNYEDAIIKMMDDSPWPAKIISETGSLKGVRNVMAGDNHKRIIVTFDKRETDVKRLSLFLQNKGVEAVLLNQVSHGQRLDF